MVSFKMESDSNLFDKPYLDLTSNDFVYLMDKKKLTSFEVESIRYFINNLNSYFVYLGDYDGLISYEYDSV